MVGCPVSNADQLIIFWHLLLAITLGGAIGFEREFRGHEAGIRTSALVCAGATLFAEVSRFLGDTRIEAGVVQGIGFLGAGLILGRGQGEIRGVTTAATIWVVAGIGLMIVEDLWLTSILSTLAIVVLLELFPFSRAVYEAGAGRFRERPAPVDPPDGEP